MKIKKRKKTKWKEKEIIDLNRKEKGRKRRMKKTTEQKNE